jgi:hypothetical protein
MRSQTIEGPAERNAMTMQFKVNIYAVAGVDGCDETYARFRQAMPLKVRAESHGDAIRVVQEVLQELIDKKQAPTDASRLQCEACALEYDSGWSVESPVHTCRPARAP